MRISLRASGLIERGETGLELLAEAVKTLERSLSPLELARALSDYGAALRRAGRRVEARVELERALDLAYHCGARRIANHARAELIAAGAKPRRDAIMGRDALTSSELRVARLAAEGLTNRQIAQALFITTKTASAHLSRVYRKLDITRRSELAEAVAGQLDDTRTDPDVEARTHFLRRSAQKIGATRPMRNASGQARLTTHEVRSLQQGGLRSLRHPSTVIRGTDGTQRRAAQVSALARAQRRA